jgi:hypothetical protein
LCKSSRFFHRERWQGTQRKDGCKKGAAVFVGFVLLVANNLNENLWWTEDWSRFFQWLEKSATVVSRVWNAWKSQSLSMKREAK